MSVRGLRLSQYGLVRHTRSSARGSYWDFEFLLIVYNPVTPDLQDYQTITIANQPPDSATHQGAYFIIISKSNKQVCGTGQDWANVFRIVLGGLKDCKCCATGGVTIAAYPTLIVPLCWSAVVCFNFTIHPLILCELNQNHK